MSVIIPPGFRFVPTDQELVEHYLHKMLTGKPLLYEKVVIHWNIYSTREPWELFEGSKEDVLYILTKLNKKSVKDSRNSRTAGSGRWKSQRKADIVYNEQNEPIASKTTLSYEEKSEHRGGLIMHQYQLEGKLKQPTERNDYVLCRIKRIKGQRKNCHQISEVGSSSNPNNPNSNNPNLSDIDSSYWQNCHQISEVGSSSIPNNPNLSYINSNLSIFEHVGAPASQFSPSGSDRVMFNTFPNSGLNSTPMSPVIIPNSYCEELWELVEPINVTWPQNN